MQHAAVMRVLHDPIAQELMASRIPARVACTSVAGSPRVVPLAFHWNGGQFVICTIPESPEVRSLSVHPDVALTIDADTFPAHVLLVRGTASMETVEAARKQIAEAGMPEFEKDVRELYQHMVRITIEPRWAKVMDFETRLPTPVENLLKLKRASPAAD